jgi:hypothetical protein
MRRFPAVLLIFLVVSAAASRAQVLPSAEKSHGLSLTAGGMGSFFQPDYGPNRLLGVGAYADLRFTRWFQAEGEARFLRYNQFANIYEDNYLVGPRLPVFHFWKATPYAKVLIGEGKMNFQYNEAKGTFTALAYGGGVDIKVTKRLSFRAIDVEYQQWPKWLDGSLYPYGVSAGVGYRIF